MPFSKGVHAKYVRFSRLGTGFLVISIVTTVQSVSGINSSRLVNEDLHTSRSTILSGRVICGS